MFNFPCKYFFIFLILPRNKRRLIGDRLGWRGERRGVGLGDGRPMRMGLGRMSPIPIPFPHVKPECCI